MKISVAALCFLLVVALAASLASAGPPSLVKSCCNGHKIKPIRRSILKSFSRRNQCIEFTTKKGVKICADPKTAWVKALLKSLPQIEKDSS